MSYAHNQQSEKKVKKYPQVINKQ